MLKGKQKRYLRSLAHSMNDTVQIGKSGLTDTVIEQINESLKAKELIKVSILNTSPIKVKEAATKAAKATDSEIAQKIGKKFVLYRRSTEDPVIELPE